MTGVSLFLLLLLALFLALSGALTVFTKLKKIEQPRYGIALLILGATTITVIVAYALLGSIPGISVIGGLLALAVGFAPFAFLLKKYYGMAWTMSLDVYLNQLIATIFLGVIANLFLQGTIYQSFTMENSNMNPTILKQDFILVDKRDRNFNTEDIVLLKNPKFPQQYLLERIVAGPRDQVDMDKDKLLLNGKWKHERYITGTFDPTTSSTVVGPDSYYLMNDFRSDQLDSRIFGTVSNDQIIGKAFLLTRGPHFELLP